MTRQPSNRPIGRFRFRGLRKLNWSECFPDKEYDQHLKDTGHDQWFELGDLLVVVGPNGGGKSTVIDLLRGLATARLWPTLARENYPGLDYSGFDVEAEGFQLSVEFSKSQPNMDIFEEIFVRATASNGSVTRTEQVFVKRFGDPGEGILKLQAMLDDFLALRLHHFPAVGEFPARELNDQQLVNILNELSVHFPSVFANRMLKPFEVFDGPSKSPGRIGVLFKDDPAMHSNVHRDVLPLGWLQLASVLAFMRSCAPGSLILLDEPDRHLHPSLQRVMLDLVAQESEKLRSQTVIATHSSVLSNPELSARVNAKVAAAARGKFESLPDARRILDDLGVTSGDLVQANGIVWVEGPSDRIYLKKWLELYSSIKGVPAPVERVHYSFVCYGGALLKHLTIADDHPDKVDVRRINRNFFMVIDRDLPKKSEATIAGEKLRILREAERCKPASDVWITQHYTMENYLPDAWERKQKHVSVSESGETGVGGIGKVELASRFRQDIGSWEVSYQEGSDLPEMIGLLFKKIEAWQTPQEVIDLPYKPPFMDDEEMASLFD
ncbi:ATP-dependent nuclease [Paraburkholderia heleia]|uniref:ATP-dependent nuclease n=1 Tax=Paraburkholderia heleia TaxID=634127 RepID=UPI0031D3A0E7